jgi:hypothetical protein
MAALLEPHELIEFRRLIVKATPREAREELLMIEEEEEDGE